MYYLKNNSIIYIKNMMLKNIQINIIFKKYYKPINQTEPIELIKQ